MTAVELDPLFVKALKLLQSKEGGAQLKAMLDDTLAQRKGLKVPSQSGDHIDKTALSKAKSDSELKRRDAEKRPLEKIATDQMEPDMKRSRFELSKHKDKESKDKEKERERIKKEKEKKEKEEAQRQKDKAEKVRREKELATKQDSELVSDEEELVQQMDAGDFARDLGIACVVCRQFDVSSGNQLVECQECHSLYHQECHKPTVTGQDVRDPRFVWYCSRCTKSLKKMMAQKPIKSAKPFTPLSTTAKESTSTITKTNKSESDSGSQAFRKIDPKAIVTPKDTGSLTSSSKAMVGLAGLAANLTKPRGDSKNAAAMKREHKGDGSKPVVKTEMKMTGSKQENSTKQSPLPVKNEVKKTDITTKSSGREDQKSNPKVQSKSKTEEKKHSESSSQKEDKKERSDSAIKVPKEDKKERSDNTIKVPKEDKKEKSDSTIKFPKEDKKEKSDSAIKVPKEDKKERSDSAIKVPKEDKKERSDSSIKVPKEEKRSDSVKSHSGSFNSSPPATATSPVSSGTDPSFPKSGSSSSSNKQAVANLSMVTANKRIQMMKKKAQAQTKPEKKVHIK